jgi:hypothetical protein
MREAVASRRPAAWIERCLAEVIAATNRQLAPCPTLGRRNTSDCTVPAVLTGRSPNGIEKDTLSPQNVEGLEQFGTILHREPA